MAMVTPSSAYEEARDEALAPLRSRNLVDIPNVVVDSADELSLLPGLTTEVWVEPTSRSTYGPTAWGVGHVLGRVRAWNTASSGWQRTGYRSGTYTAVAGVVPAFVPGITALSAGTILSLVSLGAQSKETVSGETLVTRRYLYRDGEGRWSSDPNTSGYWHLGYRTGRLETYKHIIGGKVVNGVWRLSAKNYPNPALVSSTSNYGSTNAWLAEKGRQNVTAGTTYNETSW